MNKLNFFIFLFLIITQTNLLAIQTSHKIEILVNDEIITSYDVTQYIGINLIINQIQLTNENKLLLYNQAVDELIEQKLQKIQIEEYNVTLTQNEKDNYQKFFLEQRNLTKDLIDKAIMTNNLDQKVFDEKMETIIKWEKLTSGLFFRTTSVTESEIKELINKDPSISKELAERILQNKQIKLKANKYLRDLKEEANIEKR